MRTSFKHLFAVPSRVQYRSFILGESHPRILTLGLTAVLLLTFSTGFAIGLEVALGTFVTLFALAIALYGGVKRSGLLVAQFAVFSAVFWWAVFPPLIGYIWWDDGAQYQTIRQSDIYLDPEDELTWGVEAGIQYGIIAALSLGSIAYVVGTLYRHLRRDNPSTRS